MYTLTIRPEDAKYFMEAQEKLGEAIINAFKKYWNEKLSFRKIWKEEKWLHPN